jgi:hypothetical protein
MSPYSIGALIGRRATDKRDELAALHPITSARASSGSGKVRAAGENSHKASHRGAIFILRGKLFKPMTRSKR